MIVSLTTRVAGHPDLADIRRIYNEGIEDRVATLETDPKSVEEVADWWVQHDERYAVLVCSDGDDVRGWASLNRFSHRCAHASIADLSVYVARSHRGRGVGTSLLRALEPIARAGSFHKIVLHALNSNAQGKRLYLKSGFVEVGVFMEHGILDSRYVDIVAMEKLLP
ncbi:MAG: arsinothricin resistance N-acetyltransferase ArsN1 [Candidatus Eremiobacteraeota bacterium]|nr:arsinothricin resistance N-acetyltransferase ArsN1 [Candidatus Eremiobacteraeota bacterium]